MGVGIESTERAGGSAAMAAVPSRCARIGGRSLIGSVRWYDSSHPSLADTLKDLGDQAKHQTTACVAGRALRLYHELSDASGPPSQCPSQPAAAREVILHRDRLHDRRRASVDNVFMAAAPSALGAISSMCARSAACRPLRSGELRSC